MRYSRVLLQDAATATGNGTVISVKGGPAAINFVSTGSPVGTVTFEGALDAADASFVAVPVETVTGTLVTSTTSAGYFRLPLNHGLSVFRARISAYTSGSFTIQGSAARL